MQIKSKAIPAFLVLATVLLAGGQRANAEDPIPKLGQFHFTGDTVVLPLTERGTHPTVKLGFGDGEQHSFIVDTGASVNVIDISIAQSQGYEVVGEIEIGAPGGPQIPANIVKVPFAQIGNATIRGAEFVTMDVIGFSNGMTHGVLGTGLFRDYLLTFNQGQGQLTVSHDSLTAGRPEVMRYNDVSGHIQVDIDVAGTVIASHIDTGSIGSFTLPAEIIGSLPLREVPKTGAKARLVGGERDIKFAQLDGNIQFAGLEYENPNLAFMDPSPGYGNIGSGVLGDMVVSIDQKNHLIAFRKPVGDMAQASAGEPRRIGVMFKGMGGGDLTIASIVPGSLAETAGFLPGDKLVRVNDRPAGEYEMSDFGKLFRSSTPLSFDIERDGVLKSLQIQ